MSSQFLIAPAAAATLTPTLVSNVSTLAGTDESANTYLYLQGYYGANDGGQGLLVQNGTATTGDGGSTFVDGAVLGGGRHNLYQRVTLNGDVRQWGAKCDGSTDDSTDINNEETYLAANGGGVINIPPLTCAIASTINITANAIEIRGAARGQNAANGSELMATVSNIDLIKFSSNWSNDAITDLNLGVKGGLTATGGDAIDGASANGGPVGLVVRDVYIVIAHPVACRG